MSLVLLMILSFVQNKLENDLQNIPVEINEILRFIEQLLTAI